MYCCRSSALSTSGSVIAFSGGGGSRTGFSLALVLMWVEAAGCACDRVQCPDVLANQSRIFRRLKRCGGLLSRFATIDAFVFSQAPAAPAATGPSDLLSAQSTRRLPTRCSARRLQQATRASTMTSTAATVPPMIAAFSSCVKVLEVAPAKLAANLLCASDGSPIAAGFGGREGEDVAADVENVRRLATSLSEMAGCREEELMLVDEDEDEDEAGIGEIARASAFDAAFVSLDSAAAEAGLGTGAPPAAEAYGRAIVCTSVTVLGGSTVLTEVAVTVLPGIGPPGTQSGPDAE